MIFQWEVGVEYFGKFLNYILKLKGCCRAYQKYKMFSEFHTWLPKDEVWQEEHLTEEKIEIMLGIS